MTSQKKLYLKEIERIKKITPKIEEVMKIIDDYDYYWKLKILKDIEDLFSHFEAHTRHLHMINYIEAYRIIHG